MKNRRLSLIVAGACALGLGGWGATSAMRSLTGLERQMAKLATREGIKSLEDEMASIRAYVKIAEEELRHALADSHRQNGPKFDKVETTLAELGTQISDLSREFADLLKGEEPLEETIVFRSADEAKEHIAKLGEGATAETLAEALLELDSWNVKPEEEQDFLQCKLDLATLLRKQVKKEVTAKQRAALGASSGRAGTTLHAEAGRILSLYPLSGEQTVLDEAKMLSSDQAEVAARLEMIRRQRYNQWATAQVEGALDGYNEKKSYWSPKQENPLLIDSLVKNLAEVDPVLLEPAVVELYNYVIDLTKSSISENDKLDLTRRLTSPTVKRKMLGDF